MKSIIISGSHRAAADAQSLKVANWLGQQSVRRHADNSYDVISLSGNPIPLWDQGAWNPESDLSAQVKPYLDKVEAADAIILIAPEWGGMVPAALKNFLLYVGTQHAAHKPTLIVGVSAGLHGYYPVSELRMSGYKNNRMLYIPDHLIVQNVNNVMNDHDLSDGAGDDQYIKTRANYSLGVLEAYAAALGGMRQEHDLFDKRYPFGM